MPGIRELLPALESRDDVSLGLLTGNFEEAARIKLGHFDLWDYFRCGAFGDDAADRNELVPFARRARPGLRPRRLRLRRRHRDRRHAERRRVRETPSAPMPIAVATGTYSVDALRATGAPIVLEDLSDTDGFVRMIG